MNTKDEEVLSKVNEAIRNGHYQIGITIRRSGGDGTATLCHYAYNQDFDHCDVSDSLNAIRQLFVEALAR